MKNFIAIILTVILLLSVASPVYPAIEGTSPGIVNPLKFNTIQEFIAALLDVVVKVGSVLAVLAIVYSGFLYVKAQGKPEDLEKAHRALLYTVVGTAVILGAQILSKVIEGTIRNLGGPTL